MAKETSYQSCKRRWTCKIWSCTKCIYIMPGYLDISFLFYLQSVSLFASLTRSIRIRRHRQKIKDARAYKMDIRYVTGTLPGRDALVNKMAQTNDCITDIYALCPAVRVFAFRTSSSPQTEISRCPNGDRINRIDEEQSDFHLTCARGIVKTRGGRAEP